MHEDGAQLDNDVSIATDMVLAATGVAPRTTLLVDTAIRTASNRIAVDEHMHTSIENIYAAGDVAFAVNRRAGRRTMVEHWQDAITQGTIAGANAAGRSESWDPVPGFWTTIGDRTLKYAAWNDGLRTCTLGREGYWILDLVRDEWHRSRCVDLGRRRRLRGRTAPHSSGGSASDLIAGKAIRTERVTGADTTDCFSARRQWTADDKSKQTRRERQWARRRGGARVLLLGRRLFTRL